MLFIWVDHEPEIIKHFTNYSEIRSVFCTIMIRKKQYISWFCQASRRTICYHIMISLFHHPTHNSSHYQAQLCYYSYLGSVTLIINIACNKFLWGIKDKDIEKKAKNCLIGQHIKFLTQEKKLASYISIYVQFLRNAESDNLPIRLVYK